MHSGELWPFILTVSLRDHRDACPTIAIEFVIVLSEVVLRASLYHLHSTGHEPSKASYDFRNALWQLQKYRINNGPASPPRFSVWFPNLNLFYPHTTSTYKSKIKSAKSRGGIVNEVKTRTKSIEFKISELQQVVSEFLRILQCFVNVCNKHKLPQQFFQVNLHQFTEFPCQSSCLCRNYLNIIISPKVLAKFYPNLR